MLGRCDSTQTDLTIQKHRSEPNLESRMAWGSIPSPLSHPTPRNPVKEFIATEGTKEELGRLRPPAPAGYVQAGQGARRGLSALSLSALSDRGRLGRRQLDPDPVGPTPVLKSCGLVIGSKVNSRTRRPSERRPYLETVESSFLK